MKTWGDRQRQPDFYPAAGDYWPTVFGQERTLRMIVTRREWLSPASM
jgi:hypothetical protein